MLRYPPGPNTIIGTLSFLRDPFGSLQKFAKQYGDPFTLRLPTLDPWVITGNPQGIQEIFTAPPHIFTSSVSHAKPLMGEHSIHMLEHEEHKQERALMMPAFHGDPLKLMVT